MNHDQSETRGLAPLVNSLSVLFSWIVSDNRLSRFVPATNTVLSTVSFFPSFNEQAVYYKESLYVLEVLCVLYRLKSASRRIGDELAPLIPEAVFNRRWLRLYFEEYRSQLTRTKTWQARTKAVLLVNIEERDGDNTELKFGFVGMALSSWLKYCGPGIDTKAIKDVTFNKTTRCTDIMQAHSQEPVDDAAKSINERIKEATRQMMQSLLGVFPQNRTVCFVDNGNLNMCGLALWTCAAGICRHKEAMREVRLPNSMKCMESFQLFLACEPQTRAYTGNLICKQLADLKKSIAEQRKESSMSPETAQQHKALLDMRRRAWQELECWSYLICPDHCFNKVVTCHRCADKIPYCELSSNIQQVQWDHHGLDLMRRESPGMHSPEDNWYIVYKNDSNDRLIGSYTVARTSAACKWAELTHKIAAVFNLAASTRPLVHEWLQTTLTVFGVEAGAAVIKENYYWNSYARSAFDAKAVLNMYLAESESQRRDAELESLKKRYRELEEQVEALKKRK
jgi:hypothetical protein